MLPWFLHSGRHVSRDAKALGGESPRRGRGAATGGDAKGVAAAREKGIPLLDAAEELRAANAAFVEQDLRLIEAEMSEKYGVADAGAKIETAKKLIAKWQKLTAGIDPTDRDALSALYWSEVYGKLDPATYAAD